MASRTQAVVASLLLWTSAVAQVALDDHFEPAPYINATHFAASSASVSLGINTKTGVRNATAPLLSGILFEDISHSGDGGLYAELLNNRAFQGSGVKLGSGQPNLPGKVVTDSENPTIPFGPVIDHWYPVGEGVKLSLDLLHPLSDALQVALQVDIPLDAEGEVGIKNDGWWGISVTPQDYAASFHVQTDGFRFNYSISHFDVSLRDNDTDEVYVSSSIPAGGKLGPVPYVYSNYSTVLSNTATVPTTHNAFAITMDATELRGQTLYFSLLSLFPETYKSRPNGLRKDLAEHLEASNYKFLRFPGGNNLEGYSIQRRWKWWQTIGPISQRPGRPGDWSYYNTDGLGLLEYMYWCEDMKLEPLLAIWAGFSLSASNFDNSNSTDANELPLELMRPVLQEALDELEYLMGDSETTHWGRVRASHGRTEPFVIKMIEIGNEDFFSHDYPMRARYLHTGLKAVYPDITYIYTAPAHYPTNANAGFQIELPEGVIWDEHIYASASSFVRDFDKWDNWQTRTDNEGVYASLMEYHVNAIDPTPSPPGDINSPDDAAKRDGLAINHPRLLSAIAEAVAALGWERNPNTFRLACFAPALQNRNAWRRTPYLMLFGADPRETVLSSSYWRERMFNLHQGSEALEVETVEGGFNPLFWGAQIGERGGSEVVFLKVVNAGKGGQRLRVGLDVSYAKVNGTILGGVGDEEDVVEVLNGFNDVGMEDVKPRVVEGLEGWGSQGLKGRGLIGEDEDAGVLKWDVPGYSVVILQFWLEAEGVVGGDKKGAGETEESAEKHDEKWHEGGRSRPRPVEELLEAQVVLEEP